MEALSTIKYLFPLLAKGFLVTLYLSILGFSLSLLWGTLIGVLRYLHIPLLNLLLIGYIDLMRSLPFLLLLYIVYFLLPMLFGLALSPEISAVVCLTLHSGAYFADIVRSSLFSVPIGQREASDALGFTIMQKLRYIIFPQAYKISLPPLAGQTVLLIKYTSQVSLIGIMEVTRIAKTHMQVNQRPFLTFTLCALFYFVACYPMVIVSNRLEKSTAFEREA